MQKLILLFLILTFVSCNNDNDLSQEEEAILLDQKLTEIIEITASKNCINSSNWSFTSYGSKACGGPKGYIAYSLDADTVHFLQLIEEHQIAEYEFNIKWGINSDCSVPNIPLDVICENGEPILIF